MGETIRCKLPEFQVPASKSTRRYNGIRKDGDVVLEKRKHDIFSTNGRWNSVHAKSGSQKQKYGNSTVRSPIESVVTVNKGTRYPRSIQKFNLDRDKLHPTQKPVALLEYLIKTYTNENETVLDNCMGSGSTGVACIHTKRNFIGMELDENYFKIANERIDKEMEVHRTE